MARETLADILSGAPAPVPRTELERAFKALLDEADTRDGQLDPCQFWELVAGLARGRGIADELEEIATNMLGESDTGPNDPPRYHWSVLFHLLKRLGQFGSGVLPKKFSPTAFMLAADDRVRGRRQHVDMLGLNPSGRNQRALARAAQALLVLAVLHRKAFDGITEAEARRRVLPPEGHPTDKDINNQGFARTWLDWKRRTAEVLGVSLNQLGEDAEAAARGEGNFVDFYAPSASTVKEYWRLAYAPR